MTDASKKAKIKEPSATAVAFAETSIKVAEARAKIAKGKEAKGKNVEELKEEIEMDDHKIDLEEFASRYNTSLENGLTPEMAEKKLQEDGPNILTPPKKEFWLVTLLKIMFYGFAALLWLGSLGALIVTIYQFSQGNDFIEYLFLCVVLAFVNILTGLYAYYQHHQSNSVMEQFDKLTASEATVIRGGKMSKIDPANLVRGDLIVVKAGERIPADMRIVYAENFKVDNSSLTGEAEPQARKVEFTDDNPLETKNIGMYTTSSLEGMARGVIILTGDNTIIGRIAGLVSNTKKRESPISKEINQFIHMITVIALILSIGVFIISMIISNADEMILRVFDSLILFISMMVANVPEGLIATLTTSLNHTQQVMAKKNCVVKAAESVETLGSTSVICSDKTGTLTQNIMTVAHVYIDGKIETASTSVAKASFSTETETFKKFYTISALNSTAEFDTNASYDGGRDYTEVPIQDRKCIGDATESAILKFAHKENDVMTYREKNPRVAMIPFNSTNKWMLTIHKMEDGTHKVLIKGAAERVLDRCNTFYRNGEEVSKNEATLKDYETAYLTLGGMGERVLGCAELNLDPKEFPAGFTFDVDNPNFPLENFTFLGLYGIIDPPRPAVPDAVSKCRSAGIRVIMVTGDHPITAEAIAKQVGIISLPTASDIAKERGCDPSEVPASDVRTIVIHGSSIKDMDAEELKDILKNKDEIVFARTSPQQKLKIVEACQQCGWVVAVTGDGVNDSPALKQADIGVAMGISGSDVSKEAADMVLQDDNFASIVVGIEEGRLIFDNLKKSIAYTLTSNIPEISPTLLWIIAGIPLPLGTIPILLIDLGTDLWPAISLAFEEAENDIMTRKPRNADEDPLVNSRTLSMSYLQIGIIQACAGFYAYFVLYATYGFFPNRLFGIREQWDDKEMHNVEDSYGQEWNFTSRRRLTFHGWTVFFTSIVVVQWADVTICKTRKLSVFQQGMRNFWLNTGILFETVLAIFLVYTPGMEFAFNTMPIQFIHWLPAIPFSILIFVFDELRKANLRKNPGGFIERETYY